MFDRSATQFDRLRPGRKLEEQRLREICELSLPIVPAVITKLIEAWPVEHWQAHRVVVGVSGGADSTALLLALSMVHRFAGVAPQLVVAHVNHGTRGQESDDDQRFVEELAVKLRVDLHVTRVPASRWSSATEGFEEAARSVRLDFFRQVATDVGARYVLTAHTADDVAETVLFRLMRGTGIDGLAAIPPVRLLASGISLIRPWLQVRRSEILEFLAEHDQPFRFDSSNESSDFLRNRIRHELLPLMQQMMPSDVTAALVRLARQARSSVDAMRESQVRSESLVSKGGELTLLRAWLPSVARQTVIGALRNLATEHQWPLADWDQACWERLADQVLEGKPVSWTYPGAIQVSVEAEQIRIVRAP